MHACPECGSEMYGTSVPAEIVYFTVPLLGWEVRVWRWKDDMVCLRCPERAAEEAQEDLLRHVESEAYAEGWRDCERQNERRHTPPPRERVR